MPQPTVYGAWLSEESIQTLKLLLGHGLQQLFSQALEIDGQIATASNLSISLGNRRWVVITNDWLETPVEYRDYWQLQVEEADAPRDIVVQEDGALIAPSQILLGPRSPVVRISILERVDGDDDAAERVIYDHGLLIERADGVRVSITTDQTIAAQLEIATDPTAVDRVIAGCRIREVLQHAP